MSIMKLTSLLLLTNPSTTLTSHIKSIAQSVNNYTNIPIIHTHLDQEQFYDAFQALSIVYQDIGEKQQKIRFQAIKNTFIASCNHHQHNYDLKNKQYVFSNNIYGYSKLITFLLISKYPSLDCQSSLQRNTICQIWQQMIWMVGMQDLNFTIIAKLIIKYCCQDQIIYTIYWVQLLINFNKTTIIQLIQALLMSQLCSPLQQLQCQYCNLGPISSLTTLPIDQLHHYKIIPYNYCFIRMICLLLQYNFLSLTDIPWATSIPHRKIQLFEQKREQAALRNLLFMLQYMSLPFQTAPTFSIGTNHLFDAQFNHCFAFALLTHFILLNDYTHFSLIINSFQFDIALYTPLITAFGQLLSWIITPILHKYNSTIIKNTLTSNIQSSQVFPNGFFHQCSQIDEVLFDQLSTIALHIEGYIGLLPQTYAQLLRICTLTLSNKHQQMQQYVYALLQQCLFPALKCCSNNPAVSFEMYNIVMHYSLGRRFSLYSTMRDKQTVYTVQQYISMVEKLRRNCSIVNKTKQRINNVVSLTHSLPIQCIAHLMEGDMMMLWDVIHRATPLTKDITMWLLCQRLYEERLTLHLFYLLLQVMILQNQYSPLIDYLHCIINDLQLCSTKKLLHSVVKSIKNNSKPYVCMLIVNQLFKVMKNTTMKQLQLDTMTTDDQNNKSQ